MTLLCLSSNRACFSATTTTSSALEFKTASKLLNLSVDATLRTAAARMAFCTSTHFALASSNYTLNRAASWLRVTTSCSLFYNRASNSTASAACTFSFGRRATVWSRLTNNWSRSEMSFSLSRINLWRPSEARKLACKTEVQIKNPAITKIEGITEETKIVPLLRYAWHCSSNTLSRERLYFIHVLLWS